MAYSWTDGDILYAADLDKAVEHASGIIPTDPDSVWTNESYANDRDITTYAEGVWNNSTHYLVYDFKEMKSLMSLYVNWRNNCPNSFTAYVDLSTNGSDWTNIITQATQTNQTYTNSTSEILNTIRYIRFGATGAANVALQIFEFGVLFG